MQRGRAAFGAIVLAIAACTGAVPARADASERATCTAADDLGAIVAALLTGDVRAGDPAARRALADQAEDVRRAAAATSNEVLRRAGERAASQRSPRAVVDAVRSLTEECEALGVPLSAASGAAVPLTIVLGPTDLPAGWTVAASDERPEDVAAAGARFDRCLGRELDLPADPVAAYGAAMTAGGGRTRVGSHVSRLGPGLAAASVGRLRSAPAARCMTETMRAVLPDVPVGGLEVLDLATEPLPLRVEGAEVAALRTAMRMRIGTNEFTVHVDNVFLAVGPWFGRVNLVGAGEPFDADLRASLLDRLVDRMIHVPSGT